MDKYICIDFNCSVYVFGSSSEGICSGCGHTGQKVSQSLIVPFIEWYEKARSRPVFEEV